MKSNYKRIGEYIVPINVRNNELRATKLLGININKHFMPSVANIIGTDLANYKLVCPNQFACNRMHVGRDYRIPIAVSIEEEPFMVSPAYDVFEIQDTQQVLPEYLMMWFSRAEFDRNAWFFTDADVRGGLAWQAFEDMQIPIPHITKQREIVKEYNTIQNRIDLNQKLIQKLEETAQAIYKQWFVEFEFPDENGKPYKSSGGEMIWREELGKEIPKGWEVGKITDLIQIKYGKAYSLLTDGNFPLYGSGGLMGKVNKPIYTKPSILIPRKGTLSNLMFVNHPFWCVDTVFYTILKEEWNGYYSFFILKQIDFDALDQGSAVPSMTTAFLNDIDVIIPVRPILMIFHNTVAALITHKEHIDKENHKLSQMKELLLSKMATVEV